MVDFTALANKAASSGRGPTVGDTRRAQQQTDLMAQLLTVLANPVQPPAPQITMPEIPAPQVIVQPTPERAPVAWQFDFVRNADGSIQSIKATPV